MGNGRDAITALLNHLPTHLMFVHAIHRHNLRPQSCREACPVLRPQQTLGVRRHKEVKPEISDLIQRFPEVRKDKNTMLWDGMRRNKTGQHGARSNGEGRKRGREVMWGNEVRLRIGNFDLRHHGHSSLFVTGVKHYITLRSSTGGRRKTP